MPDIWVCEGEVRDVGEIPKREKRRAFCVEGESQKNNNKSCN